MSRMFTTAEPISGSMRATGPEPIESFTKSTGPTAAAGGVVTKRKCWAYALMRSSGTESTCDARNCVGGGVARGRCSGLPGCWDANARTSRPVEAPTECHGACLPKRIRPSFPRESLRLQDIPHPGHGGCERRLRSRPERDHPLRPAPGYFLLAPRGGEVRAERHHANERANEGDIVEERVMDSQEIVQREVEGLHRQGCVAGSEVQDGIRVDSVRWGVLTRWQAAVAFA